MSSSKHFYLALAPVSFKTKKGMHLVTGVYGKFMPTDWRTHFRNEYLLTTLYHSYFLSINFTYFHTTLCIRCVLQPPTSVAKASRFRSPPEMPGIKPGVPMAVSWQPLRFSSLITSSTRSRRSFLLIDLSMRSKAWNTTFDNDFISVDNARFFDVLFWITNYTLGFSQT